MPVENVPVPGVHGANRLASNSLLEGLVFGHRIAQRIKETLPGIPRAPKTLNLSYHLPTKEREGFSVEGIKKEMQALMWEKVGIVRSASALKEAARQIKKWQSFLTGPLQEVAEFELANLLILADLVTCSALKRQESWGAHYREDFPERDDIHWKKYIEY